MEMIGVRGRTRALRLGRMREGRGGAPHAGRGKLFSRVPSISCGPKRQSAWIASFIKYDGSVKIDTNSFLVECPRHFLKPHSMNSPTLYKHHGLPVAYLKSLSGVYLT